jgi:long-chain acyl-CoA synthetase
VIGVPDPGWGEAVKAVVALVSGALVSEQELIELYKDHIASCKKPKTVDFVSELPKNNCGKILKRELRAGYWEDRGRKV